jgi:N-acetylglucosaminyldiphosphoundecaprenol N-acetyl-beta-D-mannosaminyltransferase
MKRGLFYGDRLSWCHVRRECRSTARAKDRRRKLSMETMASPVFAFSTLLIIMIAFFLAQRFLRVFLDRDQYDYLRDVMLVCGWILVALWSGSSGARHVVLTAAAAALLGLYQRFSRKDVRPFFFLLGAVLALIGPQISFIALPDGRYHYLSFLSSIAATAFWVGLFPLLMQELDHISGLTGYLLALAWSIMCGVTLFSGQFLEESLFMCTGGLALLAVFWSRHGHMYRRLGQPLAAFWGVLVAGTSMMGVNKGVTFSTLLLLPLGLFAVPLMEASVNAISRAFRSEKERGGTMFLYRKLVNRGVDHPSAVRAVAVVCASLGFSAAAYQLSPEGPGMLVAFFALCGAGLYVWSVLYGAKEHKPERRPEIWGVPVDNVSTQYALGKVRMWINEEKRFASIVTPNALAVYECRKNKELFNVFREADLAIADGMGLFWGMNFLGHPVQERIPGVDFMEQLCRLAAGEGWPVFFLGGKPGIAAKASHCLVEKYPKLLVAGVEDGFFDERASLEICERISASGAKLLFVALGSPRQELWISEHRDALGALVAMGVGGSFDIFAGCLRRAPERWQRAGFEWLFRLLQEPWRWKRAVKLPLYVLAVLLTRFGLLGKVRNEG